MITYNKKLTKEETQEAIDYLIENFEYELQLNDVKSILEKLDKCSSSRGNIIQTLDEIAADSQLLEKLNYDKIPDFAFCQCENISGVSIPSNINKIGQSSFYNCTQLKEIDLKNVEKLGKFCFDSCTAIEKIDLKNVIEIAWYSFHNCESLKEIDLKNVKKIDDDGFESCKSLKEIDLKNVETIGNQCFNDCYSLEKIDLQNVIKINNFCFANCSSLHTIICHNKDQVKRCKEVGYGDKVKLMQI